MEKKNASLIIMVQTWASEGLLTMLIPSFRNYSTKTAVNVIITLSLVISNTEIWLEPKLVILFWFLSWYPILFVWQVKDATCVNLAQLQQTLNETILSWNKSPSS